MSDGFELARLGRRSFLFSALIPVSSCERFRKWFRWPVTPGAFQPKRLLSVRCTYVDQRQRVEEGTTGPMIQCGACQKSLRGGWRIFILARPSGSALAPYVIRPIYTLASDCDCDSLPLALSLSSYHPVGPSSHFTFTLPTSRPPSGANVSSRLPPALRSTLWGKQL